MNKKLIVTFSVMLIIFSQFAYLDQIASAADEDDEWDFEGVVCVDSDILREPIYQPEELDKTTPILSSPEDIVYEYNNTGNILTWILIDPYPSNYPDRYEVFQNGTEVQDGSWDNNEAISVSIDDLEIGIYNFTIVIDDEAGNMATDNVTVTVVDEAAPNINQIPDFSYVVENTGNTLSWTVTDNSLDDFLSANYTIYEDDVEMDDYSGDWNTDKWNETMPITYSADNLTIGIHNITLIVEDNLDQISKDTVIITVLAEAEIYPDDEYRAPTIEMAFSGLDTDGDASMDTYFGFLGIISWDEMDNYTTLLFEPKINGIWRFRIPENSSHIWKVLYYPDPLYEAIKYRLSYDALIYYVDLTQESGIHLEYELDLSYNTTVGAIKTFTPDSDEPLIPEFPNFPGYNVAVPLYIGTHPNELFTGDVGLFNNPASFVTIVSISFLTLYLISKRRKKNAA